MLKLIVEKSMGWRSSVHGELVWTEVSDRNSTSILDINTKTENLL